MKRIIAMFLSALTMFSLCAFPAYAIGQDAEQNAYETVVTISGEENIRRYLASVGEEYDPTLLCIQRRVRNTPISPDSPNNRNLSPNTFIREYVISISLLEGDQLLESGKTYILIAASEADGRLGQGMPNSSIELDLSQRQSYSTKSEYSSYCEYVRDEVECERTRYHSMYENSSESRIDE